VLWQIPANPTEESALKAWRFTTDSFPAGEQHQAWRDVMERLHLPVSEISTTTGFLGSISCIESPLGMEFALVDAQPHEISGKYLDQPAAIWLTLLLEGKARLSYDGKTVELSPGDIVYGPTFVEAALSFSTDFRQLFVNMKRLTLSPRVFAPLSLKLGHISTPTGINRVFSGTLQSVAEVIDEISVEDLRPVEIALTEFLIASLGGDKTAFGLGGAAAVRGAQFHRICQSIETMLSDPELSVRTVADAEGVSTRFLQKLFTEADNSFSNYLRSRRLERCRGALVNPQYAHLSISEICFRWGFNGSAHFSRVFHGAFGMSPRDYRRGGGQSVNNSTVER
jgi:AraC-like DNA-binding protein